MKIFWLKYRCMEIDAIPPCLKIVFSLNFFSFPAVSVSISYYFCYSVSQVICYLFFPPFTLLLQNLSFCLALIFLLAFYFPSSKSVCVPNGQINNYIPSLVSLLDREGDTDKTNRAS